MASSRKKAIEQESNFDYSMLLVTLCLVGFGLLMIYSASSFTSQVKYNDSLYFLKKQSFGVLAGIVGVIIVTFIPYKSYTRKLLGVRFAWLIYVAAVALQILVLGFGVEVNGAKRWLMLGPVSFQPSEFTKIAIIIVTAYLINKNLFDMGRLKGMIKVFGPAAVLIFLIALENLSTAIVCFIIVFGMSFVATRNKKLYILLFAAGCVAVALYVLMGEGFRAERFQVWWNVEENPEGFQVLQGLYAIATGGIFGTGIGESMQKLGYIPESHNDMIFAIICEELGMVGAFVVILLFVILMWRILNTAMNSPDLFASLICTGVLIHIASQVVINIAVVTNSMPSTGIPLPFISYGGTSIAILMSEMGLVLGISRLCKKE